MVDKPSTRDDANLNPSFLQRTGCKELIGYQSGIVGRVVGLHAAYYCQHWQFDSYFETKVALEFSEFLRRYDEHNDRVWSLFHNGIIEAAIVVDSQAEAGRAARLRWFIVGPALRSAGAGNYLMRRACEFCSERPFDKLWLTTFRGLDAAAHLYEKFGFARVDERPGAQWGSAVTEQRYELCFGEREPK